MPLSSEADVSVFCGENSSFLVFSRPVPVMRKKSPKGKKLNEEKNRIFVLQMQW